LLLAGLAALALAACGSDSNSQSSSDGGSTADARTILNDTFSGTQTARSGRVVIDARLAGDDGTDAAIALTIVADGDDLDLKADVDAGSQGRLSGGIVTLGRRAWVNLLGTSYALPPEFSKAAGEQGSSSLRGAIPDLDPQRWVDNPKVVGDEQVDGAETQHVTGEVNVNALLDSVDALLRTAGRAGLGAVTGGQLPSSLPAGTRAQILAAVRDPTVDIWAGKDHVLRRLRVDLGLTPRGGRSGHVTVTMTLSDLNKPQTITAPANARPASELLEGLAALMGGSGMGGLGGLSSGGGSGAAGAADDYGRCLQAAGQDVAKAQKCADLLTH
jgi:hypothetical protein